MFYIRMRSSSNLIFLVFLFPGVPKAREAARIEDACTHRMGGGGQCRFVKGAFWCRLYCRDFMRKRWWWWWTIFSCDYLIQFLIARVGCSHSRVYVLLFVYDDQRIFRKKSFLFFFSSSNPHARFQFWGRFDASIRVAVTHGWLDNLGSWDALIPILLRRSSDLCFACLDFSGMYWMNLCSNGQTILVSTIKYAETFCRPR